MKINTIKEWYALEWIKNNPRMNRIELDNLIIERQINVYAMEQYLIKNYFKKMKIENKIRVTDIIIWLSETFNKSIASIRFIIYT